MRRWRLARGLTQRGLAGLIWHSQELVAKVEKAERWPNWSLATRCDAVLRTGEMLAGCGPRWSFSGWQVTAALRRLPTALALITPRAARRSTGCRCRAGGSPDGCV